MKLEQDKQRTMTEKIVEEIKQALGDRIKGVTIKNSQRVYLQIDPKDIREVAGYLWKERQARYSIATTVDNRSSFEVIHHLSLDREGGIMVSIRAILDRDNPSMPSLAPTIKAASWIEREMNELMGMEFQGHPDMRRLVLADEWPDGVYPLRKDYQS